jgi:hypothetical protein
MMVGLSHAPKLTQALRGPIL